MMPLPDDLKLFKELVNENRYDFCKLVFIIFPFGQAGHALQDAMPYDWQMEEWKKLSDHLKDPATRHEAYRLVISSGNGAAKTAFGAMTFFMLMYTQRVRGRITANTQPQMTSVVWPEYDVWYQHARFCEHFFEKLGQSIKAKDPQKAETWRLDSVTWNESTPSSISGLHNKGGAILYIFEEAPGIPAIIWQYASGAMTDTETIKLFLAFGNSDDPESKFEQNMSSPIWHSRRIDTRELKHVDPKQVVDWLQECNGNEDHDDFRVRVRGLPRKASKDSVIGMEAVMAAIARVDDFAIESINIFPCLLTCDPAWQGGDETVIFYRQGHYAKLLERYRLDKARGQDHMTTYLKLVNWERTLSADMVLIDAGEGTALKTLANNDGRNWELISFSQSPNDQPDPKDSAYANMRAQMYYEANRWLQEGGVLDSKDHAWFEDIQKQLCWSKGTRHKTNGKKLVESKIDIKARVGQSPDIADAFVLSFARNPTERLIENDRFADPGNRVGWHAFKMPEHVIEYNETTMDTRGSYDPYSDDNTKIR